MNNTVTIHTHRKR